MIELLRANRFVRFALLYGLVSVFLLVIFGFTLHRIVGRIREDTGLLERRGEITQSFAALLKDLRETEDARRALFLVRPHPRELVSLIRGIEGAAARSFIEQKASAQPSVVPDAYASPVVKYQVQLLGPWEKVEAYLAELAKLQNLVRVETLRLSGAPSDDLLQQGQADLSFAVAVLDPAAEIPEPQRALSVVSATSTPTPAAVEASPSPAP